MRCSSWTSPSRGPCACLPPGAAVVSSASSGRNRTPSGASSGPTRSPTIILFAHSAMDRVSVSSSHCSRRTRISPCGRCATRGNPRWARWSSIGDPDPLRCTRCRSSGVTPICWPRSCGWSGARRSASLNLGCGPRFREAMRRPSSSEPRALQRSPAAARPRPRPHPSSRRARAQPPRGWRRARAARPRRGRRGPKAMRRPSSSDPRALRRSPAAVRPRPRPHPSSRRARAQPPRGWHRARAVRGVPS
mmetsp:Transcript_124573/g.398822  ORF Transcript_124573/g.398822 Transcript_124573/m.398822 type:complete len:248 (+) Transcript_124573:1219-1962(+)